MKIAPLSPAAHFINQVREKRDTENGSQRQQHQEQGEKQGEQSEYEATEATVNAALESFEKDEQAKLHGLHAEVAGQGPGLKVVLRDQNGAVLRQFTGEEFVKLRETCTHDVPGHGGRGKLLDRKL